MIWIIFLNLENKSISGVFFLTNNPLIILFLYIYWIIMDSIQCAIYFLK